MTRGFLELELTQSREFRTDFACSINGIELEFPYLGRKTGVKIDTGAFGTLIPLRTLGWTPTQINNLIDYYLENDRSKFSVVHGVEALNKLSASDFIAQSDDFIRNFYGLAIKVHADYIQVADIVFEDVDIRVTTATSGNVLLGMDLLSRMDVHIGESKILKNTLLLACPNNTMCDEYLLNLENHFQLGTTVNAAVSRRYH